MSSRALPACCFVLLQGCLAEVNPTGPLIMMSRLTLQTLGHSWALVSHGSSAGPCSGRQLCSVSGTGCIVGARGSSRLTRRYGMLLLLQLA